MMDEIDLLIATCIFRVLRSPYEISRVLIISPPFGSCLIGARDCDLSFIQIKDRHPNRSVLPNRGNFTTVSHS